MKKKLNLIENQRSSNVSNRQIILIEKVEYLLILFKSYSLTSNVLTLDSKQNDKIIEYVDRKIKSMTNKRHEIEVREKETPIHEKVFGALYERRIGKKVLN